MDEVQQRFSRQVSAGKWNDMYAGESEVFDEVNFRRRCDFAVEQVVAFLPPRASVLDLGCGTGPVIAELRRRGIKCVGVDYSPDMLDYARARLKSLSLDDSDLMQGDCRHTSFPDASFDAVVCLGVISYVENYEVVLAEIRRILKPGGLLIVSFRNKFNPVLFDPTALAKQTVKKLLGRRDPQRYEIGQFLDHRIFKQKIQPLDYRFIGFRGIGFGPFRIAGRPLCGERTSIKISHALGAFVERLRLTLLARWLADVSVWVYLKPENGEVTRA